MENIAPSPRLHEHRRHFGTTGVFRQDFRRFLKSYFHALGLIMLASVSRIGALSPFVSASYQNVATQLRPAVVVAQSLISDSRSSESPKLTQQSMATLLPKSGMQKVTIGTHGMILS